MEKKHLNHSLSARISHTQRHLTQDPWKSGETAAVQATPPGMSALLVPGESSSQIDLLHA